MTLLHEIIIVLALAAAVVFVCQKLKIPSIVGFLLTGVAAGPGVIGIIANPADIEALSEIGVALLLFALGMEFSLHQLFTIRKSVFLGGFAQTAATLILGTAIALAGANQWNKAVFASMLLVMSSTAIVLKLLQEKSEIYTPHGRAALGILLFQDLMIAPAMLAIPLLGGNGFDAPGSSSGFAIAVKMVLVIVSVGAAAKWVVPFILHQLAKTRNRELFLLGVLVIGFLIAGLSSYVGFSPALGAFLAGLIIAESEYSHQALGSVLPFRDVFLSFFFISVGMLINPSFAAKSAWLIISVSAVVIIIKAFTGGLAALALGLPKRTALLTGLALCQVGEFSFVLAKYGFDYKLISPRAYQAFLSIAALTMAATPFIISGGYKLASSIKRPLRLKGLDSSETLGEGEKKDASDKSKLLIIGYGLNGKNLSMAADKCGINYAVMEMNPDTVREGRKAGLPIIYGDATNEAALEHAGLASAKVAVIAINDPVATRRIAELLRRRSPNLYIIARTRYVAEVGPLRELGADEVVPEEFETAIEIFARVMRNYLISQHEIDKFISEIRLDNYKILRSKQNADFPADELKPMLSQIDISAAHVSSACKICGKTIEESGVRSRHNVTILAIQRDGDIIVNPGSAEEIKAGDKLFVLGKPEDVSAFATIASPSPSKIGFE